MKDCYVIKGVQNIGKSTTIGILKEELLNITVNQDDSYYSIRNWNHPGCVPDFRLVVDIKINNERKKIGVVSHGDILQDSIDAINDFVNIENCDLIICATRSVNRAGSVLNYINDNYHVLKEYELLQKNENEQKKIVQDILVCLGLK